MRFTALLLALASGACVIPVASSNRLASGKKLEAGDVEAALALTADRMLATGLQRDHAGTVFFGVDLYTRVGVTNWLALEGDLTMSPLLPFLIPVFNGVGLGARLAAVNDEDAHFTLEIAPRVVRWTGSWSSVTVGNTVTPGGQIVVTGGELSLVGSWRPTSATTITVAPFGRLLSLSETGGRSGRAYGVGASLSATFLLGVFEIAPGFAIERGFFDETSPKLGASERKSSAEWAPEPILGFGFVF